MTIVEPGGAASGLIERVKNLLIQPRAEWERIATETTPLPRLLTGYVLPLAAIAALCSFIGLTFVGFGMFGVAVRVPLVASLSSAVLQVAMALGSIWLLALVIKALAPTFGTEPDENRANQLAAYFPTAGFIGSFAAILPALGILAVIGGIYSLVLLYMGLLRVMKTPDDKRLPYFFAIIVSALLIGIVCATVLGSVRNIVAPGPGMFGMFGAPHREETMQGSLTLPNGDTVDLGKLQAAAKQIQGMAEGAQGASAATAISMDQLRAMLPDTLPGGLIRTSLETNTTGAMGGVANAQGVFESGEQRITLSVTDLGAMGALAALGSAYGVQHAREDADGYERVTEVDGRMTIEELSRANHTAKYGVIASRRLLLQAEGSNVTPEQVRAAVETIGVARAEQLAAASSAAAPKP